MKGGNKYYVVIHGKCPGIYDDWDQVQQNIKGFRNAEYTSKSSKRSAVEFFHHKRPEWPLQNIPDFTIHASNRLSPIKKTSNTSKVSRGSSFESLDNDIFLLDDKKVGKDRGRSRRSAAPQQRSRSLTPKGSVINNNNSQKQGVPARPKRIILQQNWLDEPKTTASQRAKTPTGFPHIHSTQGQGHRRSQSLQLDTATNLLSAPQLAEFEFAKRSSFKSDRTAIGVRSPAPKPVVPGDVGFPAIAGAIGRLRRTSPTEVSIELFPEPRDLSSQTEHESEADDLQEHQERRHSRKHHRHQSRKSKDSDRRASKDHHRSSRSRNRDRRSRRKR